MSGFAKYLVPLAFATLAIYYILQDNWLEASLYLSVTVAFPLIWAIKDGKITTNLRFWNSFAWGLVIIALLLFLVLIRLDAPTN